MPLRASVLTRRTGLAFTTLGVAGAAEAHSFGVMYNLPVPFWLYAYGASAALVVSFLVTAFFAGDTGARVSRPDKDLLPADRLSALRHSRLKTVLQVSSVLLLLLCLVTGFIGSRNPYTNFNMTFFWIVFVLGLAYLTALLGDLYALLSPWRALGDALSRVWPRFSAGRCRCPAWLASWPAFVLYVLFIWIELFAHTTPFSLAVLLAGYTVLNLAAVWLVGSKDWFEHGEFFAVFFRLVARMAPIAYAEGRLRWRRPFAGLLQGRAPDFSVLLFILFMLSSTAFDGLRATLPWMKLFWQDRFNLLTPLLGKPPIFFYGQLRPWYDLLEAVSLLLSPWIYLLVYAACMALAKLVTRSRLSLGELMRRFAYSLLPIALVYNITHYYTLLLTQGVKIVSLVSDPFGWGWDLFGTAMLWKAPILPGMTFVWHSQVGLILFGHIVSVVVAHLEALRTFPTRRQALLSQLPMLVLMLAFTTAGLWILSQPLQMGR